MFLEDLLRVVKMLDEAERHHHVKAALFLQLKKVALNGLERVNAMLSEERRQTIDLRQKIEGDRTIAMTERQCQQMVARTGTNFDDRPITTFWQEAIKARLKV